jgi:hypothetical protein
MPGFSQRSPVSGGSRVNPWLGARALAVAVITTMFTCSRAVAADPPANSVLVVVVDPGSSGLDPSLVRAAIARELGVDVVESPATGAAGKMTARVYGQGELSMTFESADGAIQVERSLELPRDPTEQVEAMALLAGNLARNQAGELLAGLQKKPPPAQPSPAKPPPSSGPSKTPAKVAPKPPESRALPIARGPSACALARMISAPVRPVNLSLYHPKALDQQSATRTYRAELGLAYSRVGGLRGAGLNVLYLRVDGATVGAAGGGLLTATGAVCGVSLGGAGTLGQGPLDGGELAGVFSVRTGWVEGVQIAGLFAKARGLRGAQLSAALALSDGPLLGQQLGSLLAWTRGNARGGQVSAGMSVVTGPLDGLQVSGLVSYAGQSVQGLQLGGLFTHGTDLSGVQIGLVNRADRVRGAQIGVVNLSRKVDGIALGLVNVVTQGRTQLVAWGDGPARANLGVKYLFGLAYALVGVGGDVEEPSTSASYALGLHLPFDLLWADFDVLYSFVGDQYLRGVQTFHARHELRYRAMLGLEVLPGWFGVFAGGALEHGIDWSGENLGSRPELVAGIGVF